MQTTRSVRPFEVISEYEPSGDQPQAIADLAARVNAGETDVVLLGATGTGKSATTAWLIEQVQRPTLVLAHNKTLAAQLANEFRELMPNNAVEYFVSYYDYYQPEAYVPQTDTFIEKDSSINAEVERLRAENAALREELAQARSEVARWRRIAQAAPRQRAARTPPRKAPIPADQWRRIVQCCHPDRHGGSVSAVEATRWLLENRP